MRSIFSYKWFYLSNFYVFQLFHSSSFFAYSFKSIHHSPWIWLRVPCFQFLFVVLFDIFNILLMLTYVVYGTWLENLLDPIHCVYQCHFNKLICLFMPHCHISVIRTYMFSSWLHINLMLSALLQVRKFITISLHGTHTRLTHGSMS